MQCFCRWTGIVVLVGVGIDATATFDINSYAVLTWRKVFVTQRGARVSELRRDTAVPVWSSNCAVTVERPYRNCVQSTVFFPKTSVKWVPNLPACETWGGQPGIWPLFGLLFELTFVYLFICFNIPLVCLLVYTPRYTPRRAILSSTTVKIFRRLRRAILSSTKVKFFQGCRCRKMHLLPSTRIYRFQYQMYSWVLLFLVFYEKGKRSESCSVKCEWSRKRRVAFSEWSRAATHVLLAAFVIKVRSGGCIPRVSDSF